MVKSVKFDAFLDNLPKYLYFREEFRGCLVGGNFFTFLLRNFSHNLRGSRRTRRHVTNYTFHDKEGSRLLAAKASRFEPPLYKTQILYHNNTCIIINSACQKRKTKKKIYSDITYIINFSRHKTFKILQLGCNHPTSVTMHLL